MQNPCLAPKRKKLRTVTPQTTTVRAALNGCRGRRRSRAMQRREQNLEQKHCNGLSNSNCATCARARDTRSISNASIIRMLAELARLKRWKPNREKANALIAWFG